MKTRFSQSTVQQLEGKLKSENGSMSQQHLGQFYIPTKYHQNIKILKGIQITTETQNLAKRKWQ